MDKVRVYEGKIKYVTEGKIDVPIRVYEIHDPSKGTNFQGMIVVKKEEREEERTEGGYTKNIKDAISLLKSILDPNDEGKVEDIWFKSL
jgi:hypothetical protein